MEIDSFVPRKKQKRVLPPRRGQVLKKILKDLFVGRKRENEGGLSSSSSTPAATPSGYNSDAAAES